MEFRIIDFYQNNGEKMPHYIDILADKSYRYGEHCLPHDAEHNQIAAKSSIKKQLQEALKNNPKLGDLVRIVPRTPKKALAIEAARDVFPRCVFDKQNCNEGIEMLQRYTYAKDAVSGRVGKQPKHDMYSHPADAFLTFAQHYKKPQPDKPKRKAKPRSRSGWMGN
jgi:phage terminase large subunit